MSSCLLSASVLALRIGQHDTARAFQFRIQIKPVGYSLLRLVYANLLRRSMIIPLFFNGLWSIICTAVVATYRASAFDPSDESCCWSVKELCDLPT
jgi:hypothetical protein